MQTNKINPPNFVRVNKIKGRSTVPPYLAIKMKESGEGMRDGEKETHVSIRTPAKVIQIEAAFSEAEDYPDFKIKKSNRSISSINHRDDCLISPNWHFRIGLSRERFSQSRDETEDRRLGFDNRSRSSRSGPLQRHFPSRERTIREKQIINERVK